jgi:hypothetical protein
MSLYSLVTLLTAVVSVATAAFLVPLIPKALALPTPAQLELAALVYDMTRIEQEGQDSTTPA